MLNAQARGIRRITGVFQPTDRNGMVKDHYASLGFSRLEPGPDNCTRWSFDTATDVPAVPMAIRRSAPIAQARQTDALPS